VDAQVFTGGFEEFRPWRGGRAGQEAEGGPPAARGAAAVKGCARAVRWLAWAAEPCARPGPPGGRSGASPVPPARRPEAAQARLCRGDAGRPCATPAGLSDEHTTRVRRPRLRPARRLARSALAGPLPAGAVRLDPADASRSTRPPAKPRPRRSWQTTSTPPPGLPAHLAALSCDRRRPRPAPSRRWRGIGPGQEATAADRHLCPEPTRPGPRSRRPYGAGGGGGALPAEVRLVRLRGLEMARPTAGHRGRVAEIAARRPRGPYREPTRPGRGRGMRPAKPPPPRRRAADRPPAHSPPPLRPSLFRPSKTGFASPAGERKSNAAECGGQRRYARPRRLGRRGQCVVADHLAAAPHTNGRACGRSLGGGQPGGSRCGA